MLATRANCWYIDKLENSYQSQVHILGPTSIQDSHSLCRSRRPSKKPRRHHEAQFAGQLLTMDSTLSRRPLIHPLLFSTVSLLPTPNINTHTNKTRITSSKAGLKVSCMSHTHIHTHRPLLYLVECTLSTSPHHTASPSWDQSAWMHRQIHTNTQFSKHRQSFPPPSLLLTHTQSHTCSEGYQCRHAPSPNADDTVFILVETVLCSCGDMDSYGRHTPLASSLLPAT